MAAHASRCRLGQTRMATRRWLGFRVRPETTVLQLPKSATTQTATWWIGLLGLARIPQMRPAVAFSFRITAEHRRQPECSLTKTVDLSGTNQVQSYDTVVRAGNLSGFLFTFQNSKLEGAKHPQVSLPMEVLPLKQTGPWNRPDSNTRCLGECIRLQRIIGVLVTDRDSSAPNP